MMHPAEKPCQIEHCHVEGCVHIVTSEDGIGENDIVLAGVDAIPESAQLDRSVDSLHQGFVKEPH